MSKITIEVPIHKDDWQYREFDVSDTEIMGVRRSDGSGWVDTSDPFIWMVGWRHHVEISPASLHDLGISKSEHLYELKQIERTDTHWVLTMERVEE